MIEYYFVSYLPLLEIYTTCMIPYLNLIFNEIIEVQGYLNEYYIQFFALSFIIILNVLHCFIFLN